MLSEVAGFPDQVSRKARNAKTPYAPRGLRQGAEPIRTITVTNAGIGSVPPAGDGRCPHLSDVEIR
jgi:hypothetical protein